MTASLDSWLALPQMRTLLLFLNHMRRRAMDQRGRPEELAVPPQAFLELGFLPKLIEQVISMGLIAGSNTGIWLAEEGERCLLEYLGCDDQPLESIITPAGTGRIVPRWDPRSGKLYVGKVLVKEIPQRAFAERQVLKAFGKYWPVWIRSPVFEKNGRGESARGIAARGNAARAAQHVRSVCRSLNSGQENPLIDFITLDSARYIAHVVANK